MEYLERLSQSIKSLEESSDRLSKFPELLTVTKALIEEIVKEKEAILNSQKEFDGIKSKVLAETEALSKLTEENRMIYEQLITAVKEEILKSKKENIEAVESIVTTLANKLTITESNIQASTNSKISLMEEAMQNVIQKNTNSLIETINIYASKVEMYNENLVEVKTTIKHIKIIAILSLLVGVVGTVIGIMV